MVEAVATGEPGVLGKAIDTQPGDAAVSTENRVLDVGDDLVLGHRIMGHAAACHAVSL